MIYTMIACETARCDAMGVVTVRATWHCTRRDSISTQSESWATTPRTTMAGPMPLASALEGADKIGNAGARECS